MSANVAFAQRVIHDSSLYQGGRLILRQIEILLEANPLRGFECVPGVPAIRVMNFLPDLPKDLPYVPTLSCHYAYLPLPDFDSQFEADEAFVFRIGRPFLETTADETLRGIENKFPKAPIKPSPRQAQKYIREIISIYDTVTDTV